MRGPHTAVKRSPCSLKQRKPVQKQQTQHSQKMLNGIRKKIHEQNELLMKDIENIKKKGQTKILELKNSVKLKNEIASVVKQREDRINDLEERKFEIKSYTRTRIKNKNGGGSSWTRD